MKALLNVARKASLVAAVVMAAGALIAIGGPPAAAATGTPTAVGLAADPVTGGYRILKSNGGVLSYNAPWYGSLNGGIPAEQTVTAIAGE